MSTNDSEVDVLFATKRKRQQAEEAQKEAQRAEEERIQELERQKKQMLEDIQRLEAEKAQQAAEAEQAAIAARAAQAEREAQAARAAQEAEAARAARAAEAARLAQEAQAAKAAMKAQKAAEAEQRAAAKAMAKASAPAQPGGIKKYLPFIIAGAVAVIAIVVVIIVIATSGSKSSDKKTADNETSDKGKKSSGIENMSDPPEDEDYEGQGEEAQEYDEDYGQTIDSVIADAEWVYVVDEASGRGFQYPACFDMFPDSGDGYYQFNYNGNSSQGIGMALVFNYLGEEELKNFIGSSQDDRNHYGNYLVNTAMQNGGVPSGEYTIDSFTDRFGQETYYAYTAFDTASSNGNMYAAFVTWQDGCIIQFFFVVSKEADGHPRFADFGNLTSVYVTMLEGIVDTSTAKG